MMIFWILKMNEFELDFEFLKKKILKKRKKIGHFQKFTIFFFFFREKIENI